MQAVLLATAEDAKLQPLTDGTPAPMVTIANRPVMEFAVEILARAGIKQIFVCVYQQAGQIVSHFGDGSRWGVNITYLPQDQSLGTAGALRRAMKSLAETIIVLPGDCLLDLDVEDVLEQHAEQESDITLILAPPNASDCVAPRAARDTTGQITALTLPKGSSDVERFCGAYVLETHLLELIPFNTPFRDSEDFFPLLLERQVQLAGYVTRGYWNALQTMSDYQQAQHVALQSAFLQSLGTPAGQTQHYIRFPSVAGRQIAPGVWAGRNSVVHPQAQIAQPVVIGEDCTIGKDVELGPFAVIGSHVIVADAATIRDSVIADVTYVGRLVNIERRIVQQTVIIDPLFGTVTRVTDPFLLAATERRQPNGCVRRRFDMLITLILLVLLTPVIVLLAFIFRLTIGWPVFSWHERVWREGPAAMSPEFQRTGRRAFSVLRFATDRAEAQSRSFGRWLRAWELDRLPELWNVLRGDLSLVGLMPLPADQDEALQTEWQLQRYGGRPGWTGLWYLDAKESGDLDAMLAVDAYYVAKCNWRGDLRILLQTPRAWWRRVRRRDELQNNSSMLDTRIASR